MSIRYELDDEFVVRIELLAMFRGELEFLAGKSLADNPFPSAGIQHGAWEIGWHSERESMLYDCLNNFPI